MNSAHGLIDTHAHLDDRRLKIRIEEVLRASRDAGVFQVIAVSTTADDSASVADLARDHPGVFAAVGIHPNDAVDAMPGDWDRIRSLATRPEVVAIGETGLDRHWDRTPFKHQCDSFDRHLDLAEELGLPIIIHSRECHRDIVEQLERRGRQVRGVLHSFTGTWIEAEELLGLGLHISFAGMLTFANKALDPLREAAGRVPADRLLVETDSPYLSPHPFRGKENEPARVAITAARLAEIRGISAEELANLTTSNAHRLFTIPPGQIIPLT
ncbi:TatD family hydrolase [Tundrisphaera lichenicola]|uniref:TatD family hydrolase n=1 Tax=Tundrisphaera lichenicola TaxID=2029860 RepID=UPI003EB7D845